jgi:hypothetical protein
MRTRALIPGLLLALLAACAAAPEQTIYVRPADTLVDEAYVKPGVDFSRYSRLLVDGLGISYPQDGPPPPAAELQRIRDIFRREFRDAVTDKYELASEPGPDVLRVSAQVIDMKVTGAGREFDAEGRLRDLVARGELTFLMEVADSETGEVLARAGDRTRDITSPGDLSDWEEIERAAVYWAGLFRDWLDRSLGTKP